MPRRILVPQARLEYVPPAVEVWSLNYWTTREVLKWWFFLKIPLSSWPKMVPFRGKGAFSIHLPNMVSPDNF